MADQTTDLSLKQRVASSVSASEAKHGSGMTDGAGHGNKTGEFRKDSLRGQTLEGIGKLVHNEGLQKKGHELRRKSGYED